MLTVFEKPGYTSWFMYYFYWLNFRAGEKNSTSATVQAVYVTPRSGQTKEGDE